MRDFKAALKKDLGERKRGDGNTFQNVGGVFCLSLVYFDEIGLWKHRNIDMLSLDRDTPTINPEMIDWFCIGESRMDSYISFRLGSTQLSDEQEVKDAELLRRIEPTKESRVSRNAINLSRSISVDVNTVEREYNAKELKQVFKETKSKWMEYYNTNIPFKPKATKHELANAICLMRREFIKTDATWQNATLESITESTETEEALINSTVQDRLDRFRDHPFIHLNIRITSNAEDTQRIRQLFTKKYLADAAAASTSENQSNEMDHDLAALFAL